MEFELCLGLVGLALLVVVLRVGAVVVVVVGAILGLLVVTRATSVLTSSSPPPLQRSEVQRQAEILSDSREAGEHWASGWTGFSMLPRRMPVGKHSRITEVSVADFLQE